MNSDPVPYSFAERVAREYRAEKARRMAPEPARETLSPEEAVSPLYAVPGSDRELALVIPSGGMTAEDRQAVRDQARAAADKLEDEAAKWMAALRPKLTLEAKMAVARAVDEARVLRHRADRAERL